MHKFTLYFAGHGNKNIEERAREMNVGQNRLFSFVNDKTKIHNWMESGRKLFLDSGAYSAHTKGKEVDVQDYISFINEYNEYFTITAQVDKIPGVYKQPKTAEELAEAPILSWENYLYMRERVVDEKKLTPIFHQGEDFKYLVQMLEHKPRIDYIGISPANDAILSEKRKFIKKCFDIILSSSNPTVKTHCYGMTHFKTIEEFPFTSADSTRWVITASLGAIITPWGRIAVTENTTEDTFRKFTNAEVNKFVEYFDSHGFDFELFKTDGNERALWNMYYMEQWAKTVDSTRQLLKSKPKQTKLF